MNYTISKVAVDSVTVEYSDGAWAVVPILQGWTKSDIHNSIIQFQTKQVFKSVDDVPLKVGDTGDTEKHYDKDGNELVEVEEIEYGYKEAREAKYPKLGDQLDALYWARKGDDSIQTGIDSAIKAVKDKFPKDDKKYKLSDIG